MEEHKLKVFENCELRIFAIQRQKIKEGEENCIMLHHYFYTSPSVIRIKDK
jgi:hypothetical protein